MLCFTGNLHVYKVCCFLTGGKVKATIISAVVMQEGNNPSDEYVVVEFHINHKDAKKEIITLVDGEMMDFGVPELLTREFYCMYIWLQLALALYLIYQFLDL